jgi:hypothetical protein
MKIYVIHCDTLTERKKNFSIQGDIEWVTDFPIGHPIIQRAKDITGTSLPDGYISGSLKHYEVCRRMCANDIEEAVVFEDDVIPSEFFDMSKIPRHYPYVKLGNGTPDMHIPLGDNHLLITNNAGAEAYYIKKCFAQDFIENITLGWTIDTEQHAFLVYTGIPLICVPMCTQKYETSFTYSEPWSKETWQEYIMKWPIMKKFSFRGGNIHIV